MAETLEFELLHEYNLFKDGITVDAKLSSGDFRVDIDVKIDTGSTFCIFERHY